MIDIRQPLEMTSAGKRAWLAATILGAGVFLGPVDATPAFAQGAAPAATDSKHLDEIVVIARRRAENIQSVPVAITAVTNDTMRVQNIARFKDIARVVPGFAASGATRGSYIQGYAIRGQRGVFTQNLLLEPAVTVYFAEMNLSRSVGTEQALFDLDSVQVLKGPQGTLFGRNSTGGAVLIEPKKPDFDFGGYLQGSFGNYNFRDYEGVVNVPIGQKVAVRVGGKLASRDGYVYAPLTGQHLDDLDSSSARVSVRVRPTDSIDSVFIATYFEGKGNGEALRLFAAQPTSIAAGVFRTILAPLQAQELALTNAMPKYETRASIPEAEYDRARSVQNNTTISLGGSMLGELTLKNIIGYKDILDQENGLGQNSTAVPVFFINDTRMEAKQFSEEFQIQGKTDQLDWVAGGYYFKETGRDQFTSHAFGFVALPVIDTLVPPAAAASLRALFPTNGRGDGEIRNISYAGFFHTNYKLSWLVDGLSISGGVRWTHDERNVVYHNQSNRGVAPAATVCVVTGAVTPGAAFDPSKCTFGANLPASVITYDMGLDYKLNQDNLIYLVSRRGYRSGGFNSAPPNVGSTVGVGFDPEFNRDVEIGTKSDFTFGNVIGRLNTAVFYEWYNNIQRTVSGQNADGTISGRVINAATAHLYGGEVELTLKPTNDIELAGTFGIVQPKYDSWIDKQNLAPTGSPPNLVDIDLSDALFSYVPYKQYSASIKYTLPVPAHWGTPSIMATWSGVGKMSTIEPDTQNCGPTGTYTGCLSQYGRLHPYSTVNLRADWRNVAGKGLDLAFFATNVLNKYYYTHSVNSLPAGLGIAAAAIGAPRMFGVEMRVPFGSMAY